MNLTSPRWQQLYCAKVSAWTEALLTPCTGDELAALCLLLGVASSGTKAERIARLLYMAALRCELGPWGAYAGQSAAAHALAATIAPRYTRKQLVALARRAGLFLSTTKVGLIIGLLQWRDACRQRGQAFDATLRQATAQRTFPVPPEEPTMPQRSLDDIRALPRVQAAAHLMTWTTMQLCALLRSLGDRPTRMIKGVCLEQVLAHTHPSTPATADAPAAPVAAQAPLELP